MPGRLHLNLTPEARQALEALQRKSPSPYLRERASALLKVAEGNSGRAVASAGLLQPRRSDTIYAWVHRYEAEGLDGIRIRPGRGRKPAFSPSARGSRRRPGRTALPRPARPARPRPGP